MNKKLFLLLISISGIANGNPDLVTNPYADLYNKRIPIAYPNDVLNTPYQSEFSDKVDYGDPNKYDFLLQNDVNTPTFHNNYMYNYRMGDSGPYTYNYDVVDTRSSGAYGNCDMTEKYGYCILVNPYGYKMPARAEWIRNGIIIVTGENGESYRMEAR